MCAGGCGGSPAAKTYQQKGMTREESIRQIAKSVQMEELEEGYEIKISSRNGKA